MGLGGARPVHVLLTGLCPWAMAGHTLHGAQVRHRDTIGGHGSARAHPSALIDGGAWHALLRDYGCEARCRSSKDLPPTQPRSQGVVPGETRVRSKPRSINMRTMFSVVSLLFVGVIGCGTVEDPNSSPSESTSADELVGAEGQTTICPFICGLGTLCEFPDGRCTEACNPCLCRRAGGTVVTSCPANEPPEPSSSQASTADGGNLAGTGRP